MPLDLTKEHTIHGAGFGKDVIVQIEAGQPKLYDRTGTELPLDAAKLQERGLVLTDALRIQVEEARALDKAKRFQERLNLIAEKAKEKALAQSEAGELPDWSSDQDDEDYEAILASLEE